MEEKIEFIEGSVTDERVVARAVGGEATHELGAAPGRRDPCLGTREGAEVVFYLAAKVFVPESFEKTAEYERVIVHGTAVLLPAVKKAGVRRVVFSSTCAVYGDTATPALAETTPTKPLSPYASNKLAAEERRRSTAGIGALALTALRHFNVYGPR